MKKRTARLAATVARKRAREKRALAAPPPAAEPVRRKPSTTTVFAALKNLVSAYPGSIQWLDALKRARRIVERVEDLDNGRQ